METTETKIAKPVAKKKAVKKKKKVIALSKMQRWVMKQLAASGYAQAMKTMDDKIRFKVCDQSGTSIQYAHTKTIKSLLRRKLIYKATDGKYYSFKSTTTDESKPMPVTDGGIQQAALWRKPARSKNSGGRSTLKGDKVKK